MKKLIIATAVITACVAPQAFAQSSNFAGLSAAVGVNVSNTRGEYAAPHLALSGSDTDTNVALQLQYSSALTENFLLGFGATVNMGDQKSGKFGTDQTKVKDSYSLYLAPGYAFNSNWLGYAKVAYLYANAQDAYGNSQKFDNGWGYGVGAQVKLTPNWFGQIEYMYNDYGQKDYSPTEKVKGKSDVVTLSVGYKF